ncbi:MAG: hypothetical protein WC900_04535 [Oscillospiraceae bacterium]|jgi:hypothetical protein
MKKTFCDGCGKEIAFPIKPISAQISTGGNVYSVDACSKACLINKINAWAFP